jgi:hypothetical protein
MTCFIPLLLYKIERELHLNEEEKQANITQKCSSGPRWYRIRGKVVTAVTLVMMMLDIMVVIRVPKYIPSTVRGYLEW